MNVALYSGAYRIVASGQVFLFDKGDVFSIELPDVNFYVDIVFKSDDSQEQYMDMSVRNERLFISCVNFDAHGTGVMEPLAIGTVNGKVVYLSLWSELAGREQRLRKIEYTLYEQDKRRAADGI